MRASTYASEARHQAQGRREGTGTDANGRRGTTKECGRPAGEGYPRGGKRNPTDKIDPV